MHEHLHMGKSDGSKQKTKHRSTVDTEIFWKIKISIKLRNKNIFGTRSYKSHRFITSLYGIRGADGNQLWNNDPTVEQTDKQFGLIAI